MTTVVEFVKAYWEYIFRSPPYEVERLHATMVWENFQAIVPSAAGMDGWEPMELKLFSREMCAWTAVLLHLIEDCAPWPVSTRHAKIAYLEKQGSIPGEVMSYRPLTIMAPLYRRWASMRLKCLDGWVNTWALPQMYAGGHSKVLLMPPTRSSQMWRR